MGEEGGGGEVVEERWEHPGEVSTTATQAPPEDRVDNRVLWLL